jgi:hypothetical protein
VLIGFKTYIRFRDGFYLKRRLHSHRHIHLLEHVRQSKAVHNRCHHAHVVRSRAFHFAAAVHSPAPEIAAADDYANLNAERNTLFNHTADTAADVKVNAVTQIPRQRLTADF